MQRRRLTTVLSSISKRRRVDLSYMQPVSFEYRVCLPCKLNADLYIGEGNDGDSRNTLVLGSWVQRRHLGECFDLKDYTGC